MRYQKNNKQHRAGGSPFCAVLFLQKATANLYGFLEKCLTFLDILLYLKWEDSEPEPYLKEEVYETIAHISSVSSHPGLPGGNALPADLAWCKHFADHFRIRKGNHLNRTIRKGFDRSDDHWLEPGKHLGCLRWKQHRCTGKVCYHLGQSGTDTGNF